MNLFETINFCMENEGNSVYIKELNLCVYSAPLPGCKTLFLWLSTPPLPTMFTVNSDMLHYSFNKVIK